MSVPRLAVPVDDGASQRFMVNFKPASSSHLQQYSQLYTQRLSKLRGMLFTQCKARWPNVRTVEKIIDCEYREEEEAVEQEKGVEGNQESSKMEVSGPEECIIIGTVYKEMRLRPSVLDEFKEQNGIVSGIVLPLLKYTSEEDVLLLEDESGRILLEGDMSGWRNRLVTGVVGAFRGRANSQGAFQVVDLLFAGSGLENPRQSALSSSSSIAGSVLLVSGLKIGAAADPLPLQMLADFIGGRLGGSGDVNTASQIVRVIVAGNSISTAEVTRKRYASSSSLVSGEKEKREGGSLSSSSSTSLRQLDAFLSDVLSSCPVDLLPGASDPATLALPQQPLHSCLLPNAFRFSTFRAVTNPYEIEVAGRLLLGTSGQPVEDIVRQAANFQTNGEGDALEALAATLQWAHLAPTAPGSLYPTFLLPFTAFIRVLLLMFTDTLASVPIAADDPFIIENLPDIYFAGNQVRTVFIIR